MKKEGYFFLGILVAVLVVLLMNFVSPLVERSWVSAGLSCAIGWNLGKAIFQPIGKRLKRFIDLLITTTVWRYYQWKEKR